ncbi:hypothetical protein [Desulforhopalus singaporensis]|uniref:Uncharacterized protein n=1 Tax=Desulforhopalus singaporensis TaxID=91360 RepID=A0A1H0UUL8_9BACT|nr:hypothetical protein [Desulforhopalus singaporensis]SDP69912.1 hypothetical protein SAMN05660330_03733 [Desulforhopalus singaporensis]
MKINASELRAILPQSRFGNFLLDRTYSLPTGDEIRQAVNDFIISRGNFDYELDRNDCDNAVWDLVGELSKHGWTVGLCVTNTHAVMGYVTNDTQVGFVDAITGFELNEPQIKLTVWP